MQDGCATIVPGSQYVTYISGLDLPRKKPRQTFTFEPQGNARLVSVSTFC